MPVQVREAPVRVDKTNLPFHKELSSYPPLLQPLHTNKRIIVVDNDPYACRIIVQQLEPYFRKTDGCSIDYETDPEKAVERIINAKNRGKPYHLLSLDFSMKDYRSDGSIRGIDGDEMLRRITKAGALVPTVTFSGEWSAQVKVHTFDELARIQREDQLEKAEKSVRRKLNYIPITPVPKFLPTGGYNTAGLARAFEAVQLVSGETDMDAVQKMVSKMAPAYTVSSYSIGMLERLAETAGRLGGHVKEMLGELDDRYPGLDETEYGKLLYVPCGRTLERIRTKKYGIQGFTDINIGRNNVHDFLNSINSIRNMIREGNVDFWLNEESLRGFFSQREGIKNLVLSWDGIFEDAFHKAMKLAISSKTQVKTRTPLKSIINGIPEMMKWTDLPDEELHVNATAAISSLLAEPVLNANKAGGRAVVRLEKVRVSTLPEKAKESFHKMNLSDNDYVAQYSVTDNGPGIPAEKLSKIKAGEKVESSFGTTAFGMEFIRENIGKCDGTWDIESKEGMGTKVTMWFKLADK